MLIHKKEIIVDTQNQAHTCKTLGVVTKPMSIASTHAQMHPRNNIIHARAILISYECRYIPETRVDCACAKLEERPVYIICLARPSYYS